MKSLTHFPGLRSTLLYRSLFRARARTEINTPYRRSAESCFCYGSVCQHIFYHNYTEIWFFHTSLLCNWTNRLCQYTWSYLVYQNTSKEDPYPWKRTRTRRLYWYTCQRYSWTSLLNFCNRPLCTCTAWRSLGLCRNKSYSPRSYNSQIAESIRCGARWRRSECKHPKFYSSTTHRKSPTRSRLCWRPWSSCTW